MGAELGRISGPLLASNLLRNGVDLSFETSLLYLDVTNGRIGIATDSPTRALTVPVKIKTTNAIVDTQADIANFTINTNNIRNFTNSIYIRPNQTTDPQIYAVKYATSNLEFSSNLIKNTVTDSNIEISPVTGGNTNIRNNILVNGALHATGDITWDGNVQIGNNSGDNVIFSADVASNVIPNNPGGVESYNLGNSTDKRWNITYTNIVNSDNFYPDLASISTLYAGNIQISGNSITNSVAGNPINLQPNGTGVVLFNDQQYIGGSNILNQTNSPFTLSNIGRGYVKFSGAGGVVIPSGTIDQRPIDNEIGTLRYNTTLGYAEIWTSTGDVATTLLEEAGVNIITSELSELFETDVISNDWRPAKGNAVELTVDEIFDVMEVWTLVLG